MGLDLLPRLQRDLLGHCIDLAARFGDSVSYRLGPQLVFQFTHPDQVHEVLAEKNELFTKPKRMKEVLGRWDGNGLVLNEGASWIRQRRLVQPSFRPQRLASYVEFMLRRTGLMLERWPERGELDVSEEISTLTLGIVMESLFGADAERFAERFTKEVAVLNETAIAEMSAAVVLPDWLPLPRKRRMREAIAFLDHVVKEIIADRRKSNEDRGDLLSMMLLAIDEEGDKSGMTDQQARDESVVLLLAGNETTATAIIWTLYLLAQHREAQEQLAREADGVLEAHGELVPDLEMFPFAERVFKESMRLYPPAYLVAREAIEDLQIGGFDLPRGSVVHLSPYITQRDHRWFEAPETFRPDRFTPEAEDKLPPCAYYPFGAGPRACIGRRLAMLEGVLVLAAVFAGYRVSIADGHTTEMEAQVSLHPKGGLRLNVERVPSIR
jgi:cytochrome P450